MIALHEIRMGFDADSPAKTFDSLVRREIAAGRLLPDIYSELTGHLPEMQSWQDYEDSEAREDFHGTLDALIGWCHSSHRYQSNVAENAAGEIASPAAAHRKASGFAALS